MMKRVLTSLLTALLLAGPVTTALAQDYVPTPVTISKDKVKFKGKTYYSHVVLERQTLYSIAQAYGVTVQEIYDANPDLTVLKKNAIILIPDTSAKGYQKPVEAEPAPAAPEPEKKAETPGEQLPESGYTEYIVKWNDTLYSIAEKFGVTVESIQKANGLTDTKIKKRQVLRIPTPETFAAQQAAAAATAPAETPHREEEPQLTVILPAEASVETADTVSTVSLWQENFYDRTGYVRTRFPLTPDSVRIIEAQHEAVRLLFCEHFMHRIVQAYVPVYVHAVVVDIHDPSSSSSSSVFAPSESSSRRHGGRVSGVSASSTIGR